MSDDLEKVLDEEPTIPEEGEEVEVTEEPTENVETSSEERETSTPEYPDWLKETGIPEENPELAKDLSRYKNMKEALKAYGELHKLAGKQANELGERRKQLQETLKSLLEPEKPEEKTPEETPETEETEEEFWTEEPLTKEEIKKTVRKELQAFIEQQQREALRRKAYEEITQDLNEVTQKYPELVNKYWDNINEELEKIKSGGHSPFFAHPKPLTAMIAYFKGLETLEPSQPKSTPPKVSEGKGKVETKKEKNPWEEILGTEENSGGAPPI